MTDRLLPRSASDQLRRDERAALLRRRRKAGFANAQARRLPTVGLALSGGGVRSATFTLGLVRGLAGQRLLGRIDYLSSVSGGGFTAAMLGRLVHALGIHNAQALLADGQSKVLDWLRRNGRYLSSAGVRDLGLAAASFLRAFLAIHWETFFALLALALVVTLPHVLNNRTRWLDPVSWNGWLSPWLAVTLLWLALTVPGLLLGYWAAPEKRSGSARRVYAGDLALLALLIAAALWASWPGMTGAALFDALQHAHLVRPLLACALWSTAAGHAYAMARLALRSEERHLTVARLRNELTRGLRTALVGALVLAGLGLLDRASWAVLETLATTREPGWVWSSLGLGGTLLVVLRALAPNLQQLLAKTLGDSSRAIGPLLLNAAGWLVTLVLVLAWLVAAQWWLFGQAPFEWLRPYPAWTRWLMLVLLAGLWWGSTAGLAQAVNSSSLHSFYHARLVRAYLAVGNARRGLWSRFTPLDARLRSVTEVSAGDDIPLAAHQPERSGGAIQLVNTCLNQTRDDASGLFNADRKGTLLTASARALEIGPGTVVPCTSVTADPDGMPELGTLGHWLAISGAAAAPGAGSFTSSGWSLVMFLLGIRMGYWMPTPLWQPGPFSRLKAWAWRHAPKPLMLWSEASATFFGQASPWWYASDGGHFDNTAVYALIKRECDFIILSDASADADFQYGDIENLVRKARIDFDAEIEFYAHAEAQRLFNLPEDGAIQVLSPDDMANQDARRGVLLARIRYRARQVATDRREGTLLIVKPRLHAALDLDLLAYARRHTRFPHDSTADQFFDEPQWESYHRLGEDMGLALADSWLERLPGWRRQHTHGVATPAPLSRSAVSITAANTDSTPRWRRGTKAAVIGGSVGLGAIGALVLALWQAQDQLQRSGDEQRKAVQQMIVDVSRELRNLPETCPRLSAHTVGQVAGLRMLQTSDAVAPQDELTLGLLLGEITQSCQRLATAAPACSPADANVLQALCKAATRPASEADALGYWDPPHRPSDNVRNLGQLWARLIKPKSDEAVTTATQAAPPPPAQPTLPSVHAAVRSSATACAAAAAQACRGITIYTQIYDDSARPRTEQLRAALSASGYAVAALENVNRSAQLRRQRRPVPWAQATFIAHDAAARACAEELKPIIARPACWPSASHAQPWITDLPRSLKAQPATLELWLPTPPQDRATAY